MMVKGGAPLMRGAHKTCGRVKRVAKGERGRKLEEGGVRYRERGATYTREWERGVHQR
jgi:hypothetical protein